MQQGQDPVAASDGCDRNENRHSRRQKQCHLDTVLYPFRATCPVDSGNDDTGSRGQPHEQADHHTEKGRSDTHRRNGYAAVSDAAADDDHVHQLIGLLEEVSYEQRDGKPDQVLRNAALCH